MGSHDLLPNFAWKYFRRTLVGIVISSIEEGVVPKSIDEGSFEPSGSPSDGVSRPLLARKACSRIQPNF